MRVPTPGTPQQKPHPSPVQKVKPSKNQKGTNFQQPMFDSRIYTINPGFGQGDVALQRGYMIWDKPVGGHTEAVHFLYNPSIVSASYSADGTVAPTLTYATRQEKGPITFMMNQSVSFSLMFDRTYELWGHGGSITASNSTTGLNSPADRGVGVDILAMQQFTGQFFGDPNGPGNGNTATKGFALQGVMTLVPSWVYFGGLEGLYYFGWISNFDVQVTHWTQAMIPMRCVIDVSFQLLPVPSNETTVGPYTGTQNWWSTAPFPGGATNPSPGGVNPGGGIQGAGGPGGSGGPVPGRGGGGAPPVNGVSGR